MKNTLHIKALYCLLFLLAGMQSHGQRIYFSDTTNQWRAGRTTWPDGQPVDERHEYKSSSTSVESNGNIYTLIEEGQGMTRFLVRDDTASQKVYVKVLSTVGYLIATDTNEFVYMDYNMAVGDTLIMPLVYASQLSTDSLSFHVLQSIDSISLSGIWYKKLHYNTYRGISNPTFPTQYDIIEGIGPISGPAIETDNFNEYGPNRLRCFKNQGVLF